MGASHRLAAIDIGTVTTRLLVADVTGRGIAEVSRSTDITHLGEGLSSTGRLSDDAMERVAEVIRRYAGEIESAGVERCSAIATSASRDADNGDVFARMVGRAGVQIQIVDGTREAELAFAGATAQRRGQGMLVVDCGGGSTELILGDAAESGEIDITVSRSIDVGSRRMTEMFLHSDPPGASELQEARSWATAEFRPYFDRLEQRPRQVIGLAGTATSLVAIKLGLETYDPAVVHGYDLSGSDISDLLEMLAALPLDRRAQVVGLHPGRAGVIVAGALIFETVLAMAGVDSMVVSEHDILYGILLDTYRDLLKAT